MMNQKGGVGKTTTAVNLAAAIAATGRRILIIDLDPQAHATLHLGHDPALLDGSVYDVLHEPALIEDAIVESRERLSILPAEVHLAGAEIELAALDDRNRRLAAAIDIVAHRFDVVLIDCPPSLGLLTLNALAASDQVIVPMQAHFLALQGVSKLLETVRLMSHEVNPKLKVAGVVLCMHEEQTTHGREVVADLESFFVQAAATTSPWASGRVFRPAIRRNIKLAESPSFGQTIFEYAPGAPGANDYTELARAILAALVQPASLPNRAREETAALDNAAPDLAGGDADSSLEFQDAPSTGAACTRAEEAAAPLPPKRPIPVSAPEIVVLPSELVPDAGHRRP